MLVAAESKCISLLETRMIIVASWDLEYRVWLGVNDPAQRSNKLIKEHMLGAGKGHGKIAPGLDAFLPILRRVESAVSFIPKLKSAIHKAKAQEHEERLYIACADIVSNVHIKRCSRGRADCAKARQGGSRASEGWAAMPERLGKRQPRVRLRGVST